MVQPPGVLDADVEGPRVVHDGRRHLEGVREVALQEQLQHAVLALRPNETQVILLPNQQFTLGKLPPELRYAEIFPNKHQLDVQIGTRLAKKKVCTYMFQMISNESPLVVGFGI